MLPSQFEGPRPLREHIVLLFPGALGDFLCFAPTLFGLAARGTTALHVVAHPAYASLLDPSRFSFSSIDSRAVAQLFGSGPATLARQEFGAAQAIYSWTGHGGTTFAERLASVTSGKVGVFPFRAFLPGEHASAYYARCVAIEPVPVEIHLADDSRRWAKDLLIGLTQPVLAVHAGSGSRRKNWQGFGELVRSWRRRGGAVIELMGPAEERIEPLRGVQRVVREDLPRVAALLREIGQYAGNDSGISHLAAAVGSRGVAIFGTSDVHWRPQSAKLRVVAAAGKCSACASSGICLHRLGVDEVLRAVGAT